MPELPDVTIYVERLNALYAGQRLERIILKNPFVLRTFEPDIFANEGVVVRRFHRQAKRILWEMDNGLWLVFHLMIAGRYHRKKPGAKPSGKNDMVAFQFPDSTLMLTEASKKHRAALYCFADQAEVNALDRGGLDPLNCSRDEFVERLMKENHTLKRSLTDPRLFSGIGNAYSDEILHRAKLSPVKWTTRLDEEEKTRLYEAVIATMLEWTERLREQVGDGFPEKVTAFRPEMAVHGRFGMPCPVCASAIQRIVYSENETNYCAKCQNGGRILADRSLSRLLKDDWPRTLD